MQLQLAVFDRNIAMNELFDQWDTDRSGFLSLHQFGNGMASLSR